MSKGGTLQSLMNLFPNFGERCITWKILKDFRQTEWTSSHVLIHLTHSAHFCHSLHKYYFYINIIILHMHNYVSLLLHFIFYMFTFAPDYYYLEYIML